MFLGYVIQKTVQRCVYVYLLAKAFAPVLVFLIINTILFNCLN